MNSGNGTSKWSLSGLIQSMLPALLVAGIVSLTMTWSVARNSLPAVQYEKDASELRAKLAVVETKIQILEEATRRWEAKIDSLSSRIDTIGNR